MNTQDVMSSVRMVVFDFDGVFTNNMVSVDQNGIESVSCSRADGLGLSRVQGIGLPVWILSTEINPVVSVRAKKIGVPCLQGVTDKGEAILELAKKTSISLNQIIYVGNDINDIPAFKLVGVPVGVADSFEEVKPFLKFITKAKGGYGAVREVCDWLYKAQKLELNGL